MVEVVFLAEVFEFLGCVLWSIVTDESLRNAIPGKYRLLG